MEYIWKHVHDGLEKGMGLKEEEYIDLVRVSGRKTCWQRERNYAYYLLGGVYP